MTTFPIGPDKTGDLRTARAYFVIPLLSPDIAETRERLSQYLEGKSFTDIYLLSHGWHRNFFSAVGAYDRLISRFDVLFQRGRLTPAGQDYRPLFLAMHWNSDPREDAWVDTCGRRNKDSFLANASTLLIPMDGVSEGTMLNTLEDVYEYMTFVSAPDVPALRNVMDDRARLLFTQATSHCDMRGRLDPNVIPSAEAKVALLWRCYAEASPQRVLVDQSETPHRYSNPLEALVNLFKFLVAALGVTALLGVVPRAAHLLGLDRWFHRASDAVLALPILQPLLGLPLPLRALSLLAVLTLLALALLGGAIVWQQKLRHNKGGRGLPVIAVGSWLPLQALMTLPLLVFLFATFLFRTWLILLTPLIYCACIIFHISPVVPTLLFVLVCIVLAFAGNRMNLPVPNVFSERMPNNGQVPRPGVRDGLAAFARLPIRWACLAIAPDSAVLGLADALDKQLAFWEMQRKAAEAGQVSGELIAEIWDQLTRARPDVRLHLIGHSFGGVVMVNAARSLAQTKVCVHSLVLLQAALASGWFEDEHWCQDRKKLSGALACIFSRYDMANGFYYPASNNSRSAAGYLGLCIAGSADKPVQPLGKNGLFASLVQPPDLRSNITGEPPYALNIDASRLIYAGSPASGGGHDDVYKDDVVHLVWAVTTLA